ncbi:hypothetical protein JCM19238_413 [Vibrio ponticus]|nr:hypothetical protein JCM19238_413 [Vibrio ponticus]
MLAVLGSAIFSLSLFSILNSLFSLLSSPLLAGKKKGPPSGEPYQATE